MGKIYEKINKQKMMNKKTHTQNHTPERIYIRDKYSSNNLYTIQIIYIYKKKRGKQCLY